MATKSDCPSVFAAVVLVSVNIIVVLVCLTLSAFGIWTIASPSTLSSLIQTLPYPTVNALLPPRVMTAHLGIGVIAGAAIIGCIAAMGLRGAVIKSPFLLVMYATLVVLLLLLECALFYYFSSNLVEKGLQDGDGQWTHALRLVFTCCEYNSSSSAEAILPWSCCGVRLEQNCTLQLVYDKDCKQAISSWLYRYQTTVYASVAALHLILSICALMRRRSVTSYR